jgi:hypothetical protein
MKDLYRKLIMPHHSCEGPTIETHSVKEEGSYVINETGDTDCG